MLATDSQFALEIFSVFPVCPALGVVMIAQPHTANIITKALDVSTIKW